MVTIDQWSGLDHKLGMGDSGDGGDFDIPTFHTDQDERRLKAYTILSAMMETVSREFIIPPEDVDPDEFRAAWREYSDCAVMVDRLAAGIVGDGMTVGIVGADDTLPPRPLLPDAPIDPSMSDEEIPAHEVQVRQASFAAEVEVWQAEALQIIEQWQEAVTGQADLNEAQDWLQQWAEDDGFVAKVIEAEKEFTVPLGDSVFVLGWDALKRRPTTEVFHPGFYVPVLDDARPSVFPKRVHLLWEFTAKDDAGEDTDYVRRMTWELLPVSPDMVGYEAVDLGTQPEYLEADDEWSESCLFTDVTVRADEMDESDQDINSGDYAVINIGEGEPVPAVRVPIGLDFIPVIHFPNTLSSADRHFGRSPLVHLAQLFDEIVGSDTDESLAAMWAARPPMAAADMAPGIDVIDLSPGQAFKLGQNGKLFVVDMSKNLQGLADRISNLLRRASVNGKVPEGLLGRVDASDVPSGIAFTLSFTAFEQEVESLRMARAGKMALLLKMVQRIAIQNGDEGFPGETAFPAEARYGPFMPQDLLGTAQVMDILVKAGLVPQSVAMQHLEEQGIEYGDIEAALAEIHSLMFAGATDLRNATGSTRLAAEFLGRHLDVTDAEVEGEMQAQREAENLAAAAEAMTDEGSDVGSGDVATV